MSRIVLLGAGIVGRAAAWDLVRRGHEVVIGDADPAAAERLAAEIGAANAGAVDAARADQVAQLLAGAAVLISAAPYRFGEPLAGIAVDAAVHYLDFGGNPSVVERQLALDDAARAAGVAVVPDCGLAPGLAGVLAAADVTALGPGPIDRVALRVGALPVDPKGVLRYQLAFSPAGLVNEYAEPCEVLRDGRRATVEPLSGFETVDWPGWGPLEAFHTAGGSSSLPQRWEGRVRELDYKTLRYPGHGIVFRAMAELGLFTETPQTIGDAAVAPRDVLLAALARHLPRGEDDVVLVRTWASARRDGERIGVGHQLVDRAGGGLSALARTTAFPATALAHLLAEGTLRRPGAVTMDGAIEAGPLLEELAPLGIIPQPWTP